MAVYILLRIVFKIKFWAQVSIEMFLILGLLYFGYKKGGAFEFRLPHNYRGYVILVYGVDNAPKLQTPFYSNKIKLQVPATGILLTSSLPPDNYSNPAIFLDNSLRNIEELPSPLTRHALLLSPDTLRFRGKKYFYYIWIIKGKPTWSAEEDTINRLDLKLIEACNSIKQ